MGGFALQRYPLGKIRSFAAIKSEAENGTTEFSKRAYFLEVVKRWLYYSCPQLCDYAQKT